MRELKWTPLTEEFESVLDTVRIIARTNKQGRATFMFFDHTFNDMCETVDTEESETSVDFESKLEEILPKVKEVFAKRAKVKIAVHEDGWATGRWQEAYKCLDVILKKSFRPTD